ncbi:MAG TPA: hypothetical protein VEI97_19425, partial [bacterium]|nr:hypothetical protein [bacterium]
FSSDDPSYSDPGQILALLVGFGGSGSSPANQATLNERFIEGITNAAVAVPGQFVGRFFEEQGFRRFLAGVDFEGDIFLDMEYEVFDQVAVDYFQRFGPNAEWEAGVKYEVRDNSFIRIGTTQERDLVGSLEYRIPLGGADSKASRAAIEAYNAEAHARGETEEAEARELPADFVPLDADKDIEAIPGPPNPDPALPEGEVITPEDPGAQVPLVEPESTGAAEDGSVDTGAAADEDDGDDGAGSSDDESASE